MSLAGSISIESTNRPKSSRGKSAKPKGDNAPKPRKVSFYLSDESLKRLGIHATMSNTDKSSLVEQLIRTGLRRFDMPRDREKEQRTDVIEDRQDSAVA
jgi:hypothetical protein